MSSPFAPPTGCRNYLEPTLNGLINTLGMVKLLEKKRVRLCEKEAISHLGILEQNYTPSKKQNNPPHTHTHTNPHNPRVERQDNTFGITTNFSIGNKSAHTSNLAEYNFSLEGPIGSITIKGTHLCEINSLCNLTIKGLLS